MTNSHRMKKTTSFSETGLHEIRVHIQEARSAVGSVVTIHAVGIREEVGVVNRIILILHCFSLPSADEF